MNHTAVEISDSIEYAVFRCFENIVFCEPESLNESDPDFITSWNNIPHRCSKIGVENYGQLVLTLPESLIKDILNLFPNKLPELEDVEAFTQDFVNELLNQLAGEFMNHITSNSVTYTLTLPEPLSTSFDPKQFKNQYQFKVGDFVIAIALEQKDKPISNMGNSEK